MGRRGRKRSTPAGIGQVIHVNGFGTCEVVSKGLEGAQDVFTAYEYTLPSGSFDATGVKLYPDYLFGRTLEEPIPAGSTKARRIFVRILEKDVLEAPIISPEIIASQGS
ncbi:MAG: hypothetical protein ACYC1U_06805 [Candidatus Aquicultorales bacterium]